MMNIPLSPKLHNTTNKTEGENMTFKKHQIRNSSHEVHQTPELPPLRRSTSSASAPCGLCEPLENRTGSPSCTDGTAFTSVLGMADFCPRTLRRAAGDRTAGFYNWKMPPPPSPALPLSHACHFFGEKAVNTSSAATKDSKQNPARAAESLQSAAFYSVFTQTRS